MSLHPESYLRGHFRAEYRGEQQPESMRAGGADYALEIARGAALTLAYPTTAYSVASLTDDQTFSVPVVGAVRVSYAGTVTTPRHMATLLNVVVKNVQLRDVVYHGSTVYGVLEGDAYATLSGPDTAASADIFQEPVRAIPARGLWRLGCLLPLLTLSVGGCLVSRGLWSTGAGWIPNSSGSALTEEFMPDLDTDLPDADNLTSTSSRSSNSNQAAPSRQGQPPTAEIPVTGPLLSVALSDWNRADGDRIQLLLNGESIGSEVLLRQQPQSVLLRQLHANRVNLLTLDIRSQGSVGVASVRVELNDGTNPSRRYDLRGRLGHPLTLRLHLLPAGSAADSLPAPLAADSTSTATNRP